MLVAFSIAPTASDDTGSVSRAVADAIRVVRESGLPNETNAMFTNIEGEWDEVMPVIKRAVDLLAAESSRVSLVLTTQKHAAAAPPHRGRLGRMLHSALGFLALEAMVALFALIVISPVAVALALLWLVRRRAVDRLLME